MPYLIKTLILLLIILLGVKYQDIMIGIMRVHILIPLGILFIAGYLLRHIVSDTHEMVTIEGTDNLTQEKRDRHKELLSRRDKITDEGTTNAVVFLGIFILFIVIVGILYA